MDIVREGWVGDKTLLVVFAPCLCAQVRRLWLSLGVKQRFESMFHERVSVIGRSFEVKPQPAEKPPDEFRFPESPVA